METEERKQAPLSLRVAFMLVLVAIVMLIAVRVLNAVSIYPPLPMDASRAPALAKERDDVTELQITTEDNVKLYGWLIGDEDAKRRMIAFTGNGDHVGSIAQLYTAHAHALDAQCIIFDYRGYANSEGTSSEQGLYRDARAVYSYAVNELKWAPDQVILWGRSLGGGPAIKLAHELLSDQRPDSLANGGAPRALILEAPFTCISDMAQVAMPHLGKPEWLIYECYDNIARAPELTLPVFHFHGTGDGIIPYAQGEALCDVLPDHEHMKLEGTGHNDIWSDQERAAEIRGRILAFLERQE